MQTVRRIYRYLVAFISFEVVIWGVIQLVRTTFSGEIIGSLASQLAGALSLILVGVPVFLLHWIPAQRSAAREDEEYASRIRAWFLYGALLATLIPVVQNGLALLNRILLSLVNIPVERAFFGGTQNWIDNLIAMLINILAAAYIRHITRQNWQPAPAEEAFPETRRLYRYLLGLYALGIVVIGIIEIGLYLFTIGEIIGTTPHERLVNGLSFLLVGVPLWIFSWRTIEKSLDQPAERQSYLRLGILYALSLVGVGGVVLPLGIALNELLNMLLGAALTPGEFLQATSTPLSNLIAWGAVWLYYSRALTADIASLPAAPRRASLRRAYRYILAAFGLGASLIGLHMLLAFIIDIAFENFVMGVSARERIAAALATLLISLPLWAFNWRFVLRETAQEDEPGDRARRSLVRKIYLYLALFAGVIGLMSAGGSLVFEVIKALLGDPAPDLLHTALMRIELLVLFVGLLLYHAALLRTDMRLAERSLAERHAEYAVLIIAEAEDAFANSLEQALQRVLPALPVAVFHAEEGAPAASLSAAAVILPTRLSVAPPEALRLWLNDFKGQRIVLPTPLEHWHFVMGSGQNFARVLRQTVRIIRHLAEGEEIPPVRGGSVGRTVLYILAGLFALQFVLAFMGMIFD